MHIESIQTWEGAHEQSAGQVSQVSGLVQLLFPQEEWQAESTQLKKSLQSWGATHVWGPFMGISPSTQESDVRPSSRESQNIVVPWTKMDCIVSFIVSYLVSGWIESLLIEHTVSSVYQVTRRVPTEHLQRPQSLSLRIRLDPLQTLGDGFPDHLPDQLFVQPERPLELLKPRRPQ